MRHSLNWFEIPTTDIRRAARFYGTILGTELEVSDTGRGYLMAMFPFEGGVGGALVQGEGFEPSSKGAVIYLTCGPDLSAALDRVEAAGGKVLTPKTNIGEHGFMAFLLDTEGNRLALHSRA